MTDENEDENGSEFSRGFIYCLGLFLAHSERDYDKDKKDKDYDYIVMSGASDHLYELKVPESMPQEIKDRCERLRDRAFEIRSFFGEDRKSKDKSIELFKEAKSILLAIDQELFKDINATKGDWE